MLPLWNRWFGSLTTTTLPTDACTPMTAGSFGEDRIAKRIYDNADRVTSVRSGVGTALEQITAEMSYTDNGQTEWVEDAKDNRTEYTQDGFDRNIRITYPDPATSGAANASDYEAITYDAGGNILTHRTRRNETFSYAYDNLGRVTSKTVPNRGGLSTTHTRNVHYGYDLFGALTFANFDSASGEGLSFTYNGLGQLVSATTNLDSQSRTLSYQYDVAGRRTRITHPDNAYWTNTWDNIGRLTHLKDQSGIHLITNIFWSGGQLRRTSRDLSAPDVDHYMDPGKRLNRMFTNHPTAAYDVNHTWVLNPAGQVDDESLDNAIFASHPLPASDLDYTANGLNQYSDIDSFAQTYDINGNLSISRQSDGSGGTLSTTFVYDPENRLVTSSGVNNATLRYDPFGRLYEVTDSGNNKTRFHYDGDALVGEYNASGTMLQRYVHGPSAGDDPLIRYPGTSVARTNAHYLYADRLGSIFQEVNNAGTQTALNTYDAYGVAGPSTGINNTGRFRFTGQAWVPELGLYYYKARMYSPSLGRFMQTDPIGYADGMNIYAYVKNDPVNFIDPTGLDDCAPEDDDDCEDDNDDGSGGIVIRSTRLVLPVSYGASGVYFGVPYAGGGSFANNGVLLNVIERPRRRPCTANTPLTHPALASVVPASGLHVEAAGEAGMVAAGVAGQQNYTLMTFRTGEVATLSTSALEVGGPGYGTGRATVVAGGSAGVGGGLTFSNARSSSQLVGTATNINLNIGILSGSLAIGEAGIFTLDLGLDFGQGVSASRYDSETQVLFSSGCR